MKQLAIIKYTIMFDPSQAWSSGHQFESVFADFFAAQGFEANIIEAKGGSGERVIFIEPISPINQMAQKLNPQDSKTIPARLQIHKVQQKTPPKSFKNFIEPNQPRNGQPKPNFKTGRGNIRKVRYG